MNERSSSARNKRERKESGGKQFESVHTADFKHSTQERAKSSLEAQKDLEILSLVDENPVNIDDIAVGPSISKIQEDIH